jgi:hypothetical protein
VEIVGLIPDPLSHLPEIMVTQKIKEMMGLMCEATACFPLKLQAARFI